MPAISAGRRPARRAVMAAAWISRRAEAARSGLGIRCQALLPQRLDHALGHDGLLQPALDRVEDSARLDARLVIGAEGQPARLEHAAQRLAGLPQLALQLALRG